jgi:hypothetical protein
VVQKKYAGILPRVEQQWLKRSIFEESALSEKLWDKKLKKLIRENTFRKV